MDLFVLKKIVGMLLMPLNLLFLALFVSFIFRRSKPSLSKRLVRLSIGSVFFLSMAPITNMIIGTFEDDFVTFKKHPSPIDYVVVLGCGHTTDKRLPATGKLRYCSLERLIEGLRILNLHPEATLITSGHGKSVESSNAVLVKQAAMALGIEERRIFTEPYPKDTEEEAMLISPRIKGTNSVLVTSSYHMRRALTFFNQYGANPIPAPAGRLVNDGGEPMTWRTWVPHPNNITRLTTYWYECLGSMWQTIKVWFN